VRNLIADREAVIVAVGGGSVIDLAKVGEGLDCTRAKLCALGGRRHARHALGGVVLMPCSAGGQIVSLAKSEEHFDDLFEGRVLRGKSIQWVDHVSVIAVPTTGSCASPPPCLPHDVTFIGV
jgi:alcohol dehydrogenase class IV